MATQEEQISAREHRLIIQCEDALFDVGATRAEIASIAKEFLIDPKKSAPGIAATEGK